MLRTNSADGDSLPDRFSEATEPPAATVMATIRSAARATSFGRADSSTLAVRMTCGPVIGTDRDPRPDTTSAPRASSPADWPVTGCSSFSDSGAAGPAGVAGAPRVIPALSVDVVSSLDVSRAPSPVAMIANTARATSVMRMMFRRERCMPF